MQIISDKEEIIFRKDWADKNLYRIGLNKKNKDGSYTNGYMNCQFKNNVELENKTKIKIKEAWLAFYLSKDNQTHPYIFINDFEVVEASKEEKKEKDPFKEFGETINTESEIGQQIQIEDSDLPF